jgi:hypothetical protein
MAYSMAIIDIGTEVCNANGHIFSFEMPCASFIVELIQIET